MIEPILCRLRRGHFHEDLSTRQVACTAKVVIVRRELAKVGAVSARVVSDDIRAEYCTVIGAEGDIVVAVIGQDEHQPPRPVVRRGDLYGKSCFVVPVAGRVPPHA